MAPNNLRVTTTLDGEKGGFDGDNTVRGSANTSLLDLPQCDGGPNLSSPLSLQKHLDVLRLSQLLTYVKPTMRATAEENLRWQERARSSVLQWWRDLQSRYSDESAFKPSLPNQPYPLSMNLLITFLLLASYPGRVGGEKQPAINCLCMRNHSQKLCVVSSGGVPTLAGTSMFTM